MNEKRNENGDMGAMSVLYHCAYDDAHWCKQYIDTTGGGGKKQKNNTRQFYTICDQSSTFYISINP